MGSSPSSHGLTRSATSSPQLANPWAIAISLSAAASIAGPLALVAVLPFRAQAFEPKHLIFSSPIVPLAAGAVLQSLTDTRWGRRAAVISALALVAVNAAGLGPEIGREKEDWNAAARDVASGHVALVDPPHLEIPLEYALGRREGRRPAILRADPEGEGLEAELRAFRRIWLVEVDLSALAPSTGRGRQALQVAGYVAEGPPRRYPGSAGTVQVQLHVRP